MNVSLCKFGLYNHSNKQYFSETDEAKLLLSQYSVMGQDFEIIMTHWTQQLQET